MKNERITEEKVKALIAKGKKAGKILKGVSGGTYIYIPKEWVYGS